MANTSLSQYLLSPSREVSDSKVTLSVYVNFRALSALKTDLINPCMRQYF